MRRRIVALLALGLVVAACGQVAPSPSAGLLPTLSPPPIDLADVPSRVHVDAEEAAAAWIGPAGGTLSTSAADGTAYELDVPEYAVLTPTPITMTPITSIDELGLSGGLAGAVFLQPSGLELAVPATLRITTGRALPAGTSLVGFDVPDGGAPTELVPAVGSGSEVSVLVFHFSAPGAAYGTSQDLMGVSLAAIPTRLAGLLTRLLADPVPWDLNTRNTNGLLIDLIWAGSPLQTPPGGLREALVNASSDADLLKAVKDWRTFIFVLNLLARRGDVAAAMADGDQYPGGVRPFHTVAYLDGQSLLGRQFSRAIDGNEALCNASHDLVALANMWFWAGIGERYAPNEEDWPKEARGCADIAVGVANLATNLRAGGSDSLSVTFVWAFTDGTRVPADFEVTLSGGGFTFASNGGAEVTYGEAAGTTVTQSVVATQAPPYALEARACWHLGGLPRNVCGTNFSLPFGTGATPPPPTGPPGTAGSAEIAAEIAGTYAVRLFCANSEYGAGQATVTASGPVVSLIWSVTLSDPGTGGLCHDSFVQGTFPTSGSYSGTVVERAPGVIEIVISSWQVAPCIIPDPPAPTTAGYNRGGRAIGIPVGNCVPSSLFGSMGYNTVRQ